MIPNYDGTRNEPTVLPAKLPNLLINGVSGIAVGMATSIPPHNLREICDAILHLADNDGATSEDLTLQKARIFQRAALFMIKMRSRMHTLPDAVRSWPVQKREIIEKKNSRQSDILITEIPYQVNKSELIKTISNT